MSESYRYYAFISYSSADEKIASRLQRQIETYSLPTVVRNELEAAQNRKYPRKLKPLFRDMTDLAAGPLGRSIRRELEDSKFLIVVRTPQSARSEWVNREIENFILLGRYERILLYIATGTPNSGDPATEAFPPILRKKREYVDYPDYSTKENAARQAKLRETLQDKEELKGVQVVREGENPTRRRVAWQTSLPTLETEGEYVSRMKIVASMLGVKPDVLIDRDKRRRRREQMIWGSVLGTIFVSIIATGVFFWDKYYRIHTSYFADYVERWGVPYGIEELKLNEEQIRNRVNNWRITTRGRGGVPIELACVDSGKRLCNPGNSEYMDRCARTVYVDYSNGWPAPYSHRYPSTKRYDEYETLLFNTTRINDGLTERSCFVDFTRTASRRSGAGDNSGSSLLSAEFGRESEKKTTDIGSFGALTRASDNSGAAFSGGLDLSAVPQSARPSQQAQTRLAQGWNVEFDASSSVDRFQLVYDSETGFVKERFYYQGDSRVCDFDQTWGRVYQCDELGRIEEINCIRYDVDDPNKNVPQRWILTANSWGYATKRYRYGKDDEKWGDIKRIECFDAENKFAPSEL